MAEKKTFNCWKEHGGIGKREESVLRSNTPNLKRSIDPTEMITPLFSVGILTSEESRTVRDAVTDAERAEAIMRIMEFVLESGPDAFIKFMDALRDAGYGRLAADLEQQLENTPNIPIENRRQNIELQVQRPDNLSRDVAVSGNGMLQQLVAASVSGLTSTLLQSYGMAAPPPVLGITVKYGRERINDDVRSTLDVGGSLNISTALLEVCMRK